MFDQNGSVWIRLDQIGSDWIRLDQIGSDWIRLEQIRSEWIKLDPIRSDWIKRPKASTISTTAMFDCSSHPFKNGNCFMSDCFRTK